MHELLGIACDACSDSTFVTHANADYQAQPTATTSVDSGLAPK